MLPSILLFFLGFILLLQGGNLFVDSAVFFSRKLRIPELVIGATIVSLGTTLPEAMVSASAALGGSPDVAYGNAMGSILFNLGVIGGCSLLLRPGKVALPQWKRLSFFALLSLGVLTFSMLVLGGVSTLMAALLLVLLVVYLVSGSRSGEEVCQPTSGGILANLICVIFGGFCVAIGAQLITRHLSDIALYLGISERIVSLTLVAMGTSLPELSTAVISLCKGHSALSIGNLLGANILNILLVTGLSGVICPIPSMGASTRMDFIAAFVLTGLFCLPAWKKGHTFRLQGVLLLGCYLFYCLGLF